MENKDSERKNKRRLTFWATIGLFLVTFGKNAILILKSAKFLTPFITMIISIGAYALLAPLEFAIGFVVLILVHELGHVWAAKMKGLPVSAPLFIPFLGALITMKRNPRDAQTEAFVAIGGPVIGTLGALVFLWVGLAFGNVLFIQLAYVGLFLNLINLLPIHPLDGGRIAVAVSRWLWLVGLIGGFILIVFYLRSPLFFIIWAFFAWNLFQQYVLKKRRHGQSNYMSGRFRVEIDQAIMPSWFVPGENHRRELPWQTYSSLDGQQTVEFRWDGIELDGKMELPSQCLIDRVHVTDIRHIFDDGRMIAFEVEVTANAHVFENDRYYEVQPAVRWMYGAAFATLTIVILGVMFWIHELLGVSGLR
jgi:Zn-dependent protease